VGAEKYKIMRGAALTGGARHMASAWKRLFERERRQPGKRVQWRGLGNR